MKTLRSRLLASYTLVILLCLAVVGGALLLLLARLSLPERQIYQELNSLSRMMAFRPLLDDLLRNQPPERLEQTLQRLADAQNTRIILAELDGRVVADTHGALVGQNLLQEARLQERSPELIQGSFRPAGTLQRWLFVGRTLTRPGEQQARWLVFSRQAPRLSIFTLYGENILSPLVQAGLVGLVVAVLLALLISRSVAKPVQQTAAAAQAVAAGDYGQRITPSGPAELQELAHSFNRMAQQVQASQQAQQDFVANVSHDLKTPLTSIQGFSQAILDGTAGDPEAVRRAAGVIHDEAGRMRRMVDDLLLLARMDAGQLKLDWQPLELNALLAGCLTRMEPRARAAGVRLEMELPPALPPVNGDGDRLVQLFTNLLDNALKHTPAGGKVKVTGEARDDWVAVGVADTGPGIPQEQLGRIFERFYQLDRSRARSDASGVGLGLAICQELAAAHGGRISAESVVGVGTKVSVHLPAPGSAVTVARRR